MTSFRREDLLRALPYARRYARALAGGQVAGDALVADALRELLSGAEDEAFDARLALYKAVTMRRPDPEALMPGDQSLTGAQRKLLLLTSLEEVPLAKAATILGLEKSDAEQMLSCARDRLRLAAAADVLIIEDEPIIAMDIEELVAGCGHRVVGVAATEADAVEIAERCRPGLILADINLGAGGDGTSAVSRILRSHYAPVIFVTAYPERLLTGEALEPAFVITKPFEPLTLAIATYQAVTGGVRIA
jgi:CheY-like chemotaxis protein